jgi:tetratricopeptide (TPR) repeat protein
VPDSLHALLAARLDALPPEVRALVADAAVLGSTFPPEALIAISKRDEEVVRDALTELLRREVLDISADPLSPQRGTYRFAQEMLRQVAYETLSRRDRKARHLAVASHLRATFDNDGEEVMDVVARHYLDAMAAVSDDPDHDVIRKQAIDALSRAAERAQRTGAPARAAGLFGQAAELLDVSDADADSSQAAAELWERALRANDNAADWGGVLSTGERAEAIYRRTGKLREAARVASGRGRAFQQLGRHTEARPLLTEALDVLMAEPDADAVTALSYLAALEVFQGSPDADRITTEVLTLCQALAVDVRMLVRAFIGRGLFLQVMGRRLESIAYYREAARLADRVDERRGGGLAMSNQSDALAVDDPAGAAEAARIAIELCRGAGDRASLGTARANLAYAQISLGEWQEAQSTFDEGVHADGTLGAYLSSIIAWLATLRGDLDGIDGLLAELEQLRQSDDAQDQAALLRVEAFGAAARGDLVTALSTARKILELAPMVGIHAEMVCWAWPLATRCAFELGDRRTVIDLVEMLDAYQPGLLAPLQRIERELVRARLAAADGRDGVEQDFAAAVAALRSGSTPYHLAHGLLDQAQFSLDTGDPSAASVAISEAKRIAERLGCGPLLTRAEQVATIGSVSTA